MSTHMARVLVVEDERDVAAVLHDALIDLGYTVRLASDGAAALEIMPTYRPDVVLLDLNVPEVPGDVVLKRLREADPSLPVIIVTANADAERARATIARGAFHYIAKPFDLDPWNTSSRRLWSIADELVRIIVP
jgi:DNA-binding NtrC family response regulator